MITVLLADDQALVRSGFRMLIDAEEDMQVVGEAADGSEACAAVARTHADVVLMDIRMPRLDGIHATAQVLAARPSARVLVLTTFDADELVVDAIRAGAAGFLLKDSSPERIVASVRQVAAGEPGISPSVLTQLMGRAAGAPCSGRGDDARRRLAQLTARERDVVDCLSYGLSNAEVAEQLVLSVPTVKAHVSSILAKLGAENRVQVALLVQEARG